MLDKFEKVSGIYVIYNKINGKCYVGESVNLHRRIHDHRRTDELIIDKAIKKYGVDNFIVYPTYLPDFSKKDLVDLEEKCIEKFNSVVPNGYNILKRGDASGANLFKGRKHSEETKRKISQKAMGHKRNLGFKHSKERNDKISKSKKGQPSKMRGRTHTEEAKLNMSKAQKGVKHSELHRKRNGDARRGKKLPEATRIKMSISHTGKIVSEETRRKISLIHTGKITSEETKEKISLAAKNRDKVICPHCEMSLTPQNSNRWHFNNCKYKKITP